MFNGSNCDQKSQLSGISTEPLSPRDTGLVQGTVSVQWVGGFGNWPRPLTC